MGFNNVIYEYLKYFFIISNMSIYKFIVKFMMSLKLLIIKSAQLFNYKILGRWDRGLYCKG